MGARGGRDIKSAPKALEGIIIRSHFFENFLHPPSIINDRAIIDTLSFMGLFLSLIISFEYCLFLV